MIGEFDRREGWVTWGCKNCAEWLAYRCGMSYRAARDHVRVANALRELPKITGEFGAGRLSYSKVRTLVRVARTDTEEDLIGIARHATAAQLARLLGAYRRVCDEDETERARRQYRDRLLAWDEDEAGMTTITVKLPPEQGELVIKAIDAGVEQIRAEQRGTAVPRLDHELSYVQAAADAIVRMAERFAADAVPEASAGDRHQVVVHVDLETLRDDADGRCEIEGKRIAPETARRLACDASLVPMVEKDGEILTVGRKSRSPSTAIRRALRARDGGCRYPGCPRRAFVESHHIDHWTRGGETKLSNLIQLCRFHHRFVHEGRYTVEMQADGTVVFTSPLGKRIGTAVPPSIEGHLEGLRSDIEPMPLSYADRIDLADGVDALVSMDRDLTRRRAG